MLTKILGRWRFKGIGKNLSESLLDQCGKHIPNASAVHEKMGPPRYRGDYRQIVETSNYLKVIERIKLISLKEVN